MPCFRESRIEESCMSLSPINKKKNAASAVGLLRAECIQRRGFGDTDGRCVLLQHLGHAHLVLDPRIQQKNWRTNHPSEAGTPIYLLMR